MNEPTWVSQRVPQLGTMMSDGNLKALGRSEMSPLTVLVREAAQNSWDARDDGGRPVRFGIDLVRLGDEHRQRWRDVLTADAPPQESVPVEATIQAQDLRLLVVSDRGTRGLGGPVRGGLPKDPNVREDYASFVLNSGVPRDTTHGGGTYGFGKGIFFRLSRCGVAAVYTRCARLDGNTESRFIVCAVGKSIPHAGRQLAGRHWWGLAAEDHEAVKPLTGAEADAAAAAFGLPPFADGDLGTSIAIVDPDLDGQDPDMAAAHMAEAMTWNLWPKMLPRANGQADMLFSVRIDGVEIPVPDPTDHKMLTTFVLAYRALAEGGQEIRHKTLKTTLGRLRLQSGFGVPEQLPTVAKELGFGDRVHHVCLMRPAELVVRYLPGAPPVDEHMWYGGVFKADLGVEAIFADAEPPTHDAWNAEELKGADRLKVKHALSEIRLATRTHVVPAPVGGRQHEILSLGAASSALAGLVTPASGTGPDRRKPPSGRSTPGPFVIRLDGRPRWDAHQDEAILVQRMDVDARRPGILEATARIDVWGGGSNSDGAETRGPSILGWFDSRGRLTKGARLSVEAGKHVGLSVAVVPVADTVTSIGVTTSELSDEG